jgi:hypothetical protein
MTNADAENFWELIQKKCSPSWDDIEEVEPDETDLEMLKAINTNPGCHVFTNEKDIVWD